MGLDVIALGKEGPHPVDELLLHELGLVEGQLRHDLLVVEVLAADDLVDPFLGDLQLAQHVGHLVDVGTRPEVRRRPLHHRDVAALASDGRHQRRRRGARTDDDDGLTDVVEIVRPGLGVHDVPREAVHPLPTRSVPLRVPVVALAHP